MRTELAPRAIGSRSSVTNRSARAPAAPCAAASSLGAAGAHLSGTQGWCGRPANQSVPANWPRLTESRGRPGLDLALAGACWRANWPKPLGGCYPHRREHEGVDARVKGVRARGHLGAAWEGVAHEDARRGARARATGRRAGAPARVGSHHATAGPHHRSAVHALEWEPGARRTPRRARIEQARLRHASARLELMVLASPPRPFSRRRRRQPLPSAQRQRRAGIPLQPPAPPRGSPEVELLLGSQRGEHVGVLASAPRRQGGGAAHEVGRKRAAEAAEEEGAAALRVAEQEEVGEQPVGDHGVHGDARWRALVRASAAQNRACQDDAMAGRSPRVRVHSRHARWHLYTQTLRITQRGCSLRVPSFILPLSAGRPLEVAPLCSMLRSGTRRLFIRLTAVRPVQPTMPGLLCLSVQPVRLFQPERRTLRARPALWHGRALR